MLQPAIGVLVLIATFALVLGAGQPASLAGDVGVRDEDACAALEGLHGAHAVERLEASGFPRATTDDVEIYRLIHEGKTEAAILITWNAKHAECVPLEAAPWISAELHLKDGAYRALVGELQHVLDAGRPSWHVANWWAIFWGADVEIPTNDAYERPYKLQLARWAAGQLAPGVA